MIRIPKLLKNRINRITVTINKRDKAKPVIVKNQIPKIINNRNRVMHRIRNRIN